jgi:predicted aspartyl protease
VRAIGWAAAACVLLAGAASAEWMQPDASYREAQFVLRMAARDTAGASHQPGRLDSLGVALLRLGQLDEADRIFARVLELAPGDVAAREGRGKIALFRGRVDDALGLIRDDAVELGALRDRFAALVRKGDYAAAAALAPRIQLEGRAPLLERMAAGSYVIAQGPDEAEVLFSRSYPVPLVRVKLNGQSVLMALDTGANDILLDESAARRCRVDMMPSRATTFWSGALVAVRNAMVQRLDIGGFRVEQVPAGVLSLRKWSLEVNPHSEPVAGVIGLQFLRRFQPTIDLESHRLVLRRPGTAFTPGPGAQRIPFELWGECELTVYGSIAGGRRMAFVVQSGVPGCGIGAPAEVFDEVGVKPGLLSKVAKGVGAYLQGRPWSAVTVPVVSVGPIAKDKLAGWSGALDAAELWRHGVRRDALLSHDFLRDWRVTIDWARMELVFEEK